MTLDLKVEDMFFGEISLKLDDKGRVSIPSHYRKVIKKLDKSADRIFIQKSSLEKKPVLNVYSSSYLSLIKSDCGTLEEFAIDEQGRIAIPSVFMEYLKCKNGGNVAARASPDGKYFYYKKI